MDVLESLALLRSVEGYILTVDYKGGGGCLLMGVIIRAPESLDHLLLQFPFHIAFSTLLLSSLHGVGCLQILLLRGLGHGIWRDKHNKKTCLTHASS